ncbi:MAG: TolC family protein [Myxococcota bacterium]
MGEVVQYRLWKSVSSEGACVFYLTCHFFWQWLAVLCLGVASLTAHAGNMSGGPPANASSAAEPSGSGSASAAPSSGAPAISQGQGSYVLKMCQHIPEFSLSQVVQRALQQDASIQLSREQVKQQQAQYRINWAALLPKLSVMAQHTSNVPQASSGSEAANPAAQAQLYEQVAKLSDQAGDTQAAAGLRQAAEAVQAQATQSAGASSFGVMPDQKVDTAFTISVPLFHPAALIQLRSGKLNVRSAQNRLQHTRSSTLLSAVQGFYAVETQQQQLRQAQAFVDTAQAHQTFVQERVHRGLRKAVELTRAQLQLQQALQALRQAQLNHQFAVGALGMLLGEDCFFHVRKPSSSLLKPDHTPPLQEVVQRSLQSRLDLRAKHMAVKSIRATYQSASFLFLPLVEFASQTRYSHADPVSSADPWSTSLSIKSTWSLFEGGRRFAQWSQASSLLRSERIGAHLLQRQVQGQARAAVHELQTRRQQVNTLETSLELAKQLQEDTRILYRQGSDAVTSTDMINANYKVFEAQTQLHSMQAQLQVAWVKLLHVQGLLKPAVFAQ